MFQVKLIHILDDGPNMGHHLASQVSGGIVHLGQINKQPTNIEQISLLTLRASQGGGTLLTSAGIWPLIFDTRLAVSIQTFRIRESKAAR